MSNGLKYWNHDRPRVSRNWERVQTREKGDIPGITKAHDVWVDIPQDAMQNATRARAAEFCWLLENLRFQDFNNHPFHHTDVELSPITNPSSRIRRAWDWDFQG